MQQLRTEIQQTLFEWRVQFELPVKWNKVIYGVVETGFKTNGHKKVLRYEIYHCIKTLEMIPSQVYY